MLSKILSWIRRTDMVHPGDRVVCAVSGGADSVAMLFALYLLRDKLGITLEAAHFNHHLRGEESDRDEAFVREFCSHYDIPLHLGGEAVTAGEKGLEAAARDARYRFLQSIPGRIATAHTADDNAETLLMHLIRGTGLKGLGGIAPIRGVLIRPMLPVTRQEVEDFLAEWCLPHVEDSSNGTDDFLRNRIRHHVMPLLRQENPRIAQSLSRTALRLRDDERCLAAQLEPQLPSVTILRTLDPALRRRYLERFLKDSGVREPEDSHITQAENLVLSPKPSASARFPGGVTIARRYDSLTAVPQEVSLEQAVLPCPGQVIWGGYRVTCTLAEEIVNTAEAFTVCPQGEILLRSRCSGDSLTLPGGTASVKKLFIDRKIPRDQRLSIPVAADSVGILGVYSLGVHQKRAASALPAVTIRFEKI